MHLQVAGLHLKMLRLLHMFCFKLLIKGQSLNCVILTANQFRLHLLLDQLQIRDLCLEVGVDLLLESHVSFEGHLKKLVLILL